MEGHTVTFDDLKRRFSHHPPPNERVGNDHARVRELLLEAADEIVKLTGAPSREQSTALSKLEEAMMWTNADIARKGSDAVAAHQL